MQRRDRTPPAPPPTEELPEHRDPKKIKWDAVLRYHVGIRPSSQPGGKPTGYVLREVEGGKKVSGQTERKEGLT